MYDKDDHKIIGSLIDKVGSKEEYLRLGFLDRSDNETLFVTVAGFGFLLCCVLACDIETLAEAAGFEQGYEQALAA